MSLPDVLVSTGHMFLHFQDLFTDMDEYPPSLVNVIPGVPEERELGSSHLLNLGVIDRQVGGEIIHTHIVKPGFRYLVFIGEVGKKVDYFHIHFISHYKDNGFFWIFQIKCEKIVNFMKVL